MSLLEDALRVMNDLRIDVRETKFGGLQCDALERLLREQLAPRPISTAPKDGTPFLAWYPKHQLDEDDESTDEVIGGACALVTRNGNEWEEPEWLGAHGSYYMEDWCFADLPVLWLPQPPDPTEAELEIALGVDCTEPNRAACPRKCIDFCNKAESAKHGDDDGERT